LTNRPINGQAVVHYSRNPFSGVRGLTYVTAFTYGTRQPMTSKLALLALWSVRQKLKRVSSVQFTLITSLCTRLKINPRTAVDMRVLQ